LGMQNGPRRTCLATWCSSNALGNPAAMNNKGVSLKAEKLLAGLAWRGVHHAEALVMHTCQVGGRYAYQAGQGHQLADALGALLARLGDQQHVVEQVPVMRIAR
jgi:hypothetical protein